MRLLDLFCCAGGAGTGYHRAGFEVVGVDKVHQPRYPFEFHQADALEYLAEHGHEFDAIHASPPCQRHSTMTIRWGRQEEHPNLIGPTRKALMSLGKPYVMENVVGAPLCNAVVLCGSMFGLRSGEWQLQRHRLFESNIMLWTPGECRHKGRALAVYGHAGGTSRRDGIRFPGTGAWPEGMGIDWMTGEELAEAIPPAYTEWIGKQLRVFLEGRTQMADDRTKESRGVGSTSAQVPNLLGRSSTMSIVAAVLIVCQATTAPTQQSADPFARALKAMVQVESRGNPNAVGDGGRAIGVLQIHHGYWQDGTRFLGVSWPYSDARDPAKAEAVVLAYTQHYAKANRLPWTVEVIARIHNGGPRGMQKQATIRYYRMVQKMMEVN